MLLSLISKPVPRAKGQESGVAMSSLGIAVTSTEEGLLAPRADSPRNCLHVTCKWRLLSIPPGLPGQHNSFLSFSSLSL